MTCNTVRSLPAILWERAAEGRGSWTDCRSSGGVYCAQKLHELVANLGGRFMLYPVTGIVEFETAHETGKAGAKLVHRKRIEFFHAIRLASNEEGRLGDFRAFPCGGQKEIRFGGAIIVETTVKAGTLEFSDVVGNVIGFGP